MRIRVLRRGEDSFQVMAEQATRKGKKVTVGKTVPRRQLKEETARLLEEVRGPGL